jgi:hypothetical protein
VGKKLFVSFTAFLAFFAFAVDTPTMSQGAGQLSQGKTIGVSLTIGEAALTPKFVTKKMPQKKLFLEAKSAAYVGRAAELLVTGGSGTGKRTYKVVSGNCFYQASSGVYYTGQKPGLFLKQTKPSSCVVQVFKAADSKYAASQSNKLVVSFKPLPGQKDYWTIKFLILEEEDAWSIEGRKSAPASNSAFKKLLAASKQSSVRYALYWSALAGFWEMRIFYLEMAIETLEGRIGRNSELGVEELNPELEKKLEIQLELLDQVSQIGDLMEFYERDLEYGYRY